MNNHPTGSTGNDDLIASRVIAVSCAVIAVGLVWIMVLLWGMTK